MVALIAVSFVLLVIGFSRGFETNDGAMTDVLLRWAYVMVALAAASWVVVGLVLSIMNNPKGLIKTGIAIAIMAVVCLIAFLLAPGSQPMAYNGDPQTEGTLKLTDTILNLTYIAGVAAIAAIIVGEVKMSLTNKK